MPSSNKSIAAALCATLALGPLQGKPGDEVYQRGYLSKEDALRSIQLQVGYSLQLVLSEPFIQEPVTFAWDGNGVLYVAEMRTYMQDADATGEQTPVSRISRHEDTNGDGIYDKHSVFIDQLLLPRMILPLDDRLMVGVTNTLDLWTYRDTNGDGVADEVVKVYNGGPRGGNMEHQPSGLVWNIDNWIYLTYEAKRYRFTDGKFQVQQLPAGVGQWGLTQDNAGRLFYSTAGGEIPAYNFQQPMLYGSLNLRGQEESDFRKIYPIAAVPDVQGGESRVGPNGGLSQFSGCGGQAVYRGDRLPADLRDNLLIPEPVGRLIRRARVERKEGKSVLYNVYPQSEFIRSRDINFRPLWAATSPDGAMMILDIHRGIIQQGDWTRPGSYLREVIDKWGLDKNTGRGRLYRLVHRDFKPDQRPRLLEETTTGLVRYLAHPNGWWRDTAQKLILLRPDRDTAIPLLEKLARGATSELARMHALWTLEGMDSTSPELIISALQDSSSLVRTTGIRLAEPYFAVEDPAVLRATFNLAEKSANIDIENVLQLINSIGVSGATEPALMEMRDALWRRFPDNEAVRAVGSLYQQIADEKLAKEALRRQNERLAKSMESGELIYQQLCSTCHGADGNGVPMAGTQDGMLAPPLSASPRVSTIKGDSIIRVLLHGLTGELNGRQYDGTMVPMGTNSDGWIADVATYVRNSFGNTASAISEQQVAAIRKEHLERNTPWTQSELEQLDAPLLVNQADWKLSSSHGGNSLQNACDGKLDTRFTTMATQRPGMWFQIELPNETLVQKLFLDTRPSSGDYPRGYEITVSDDGISWSKPLVTDHGTIPVTEIELPLGTKTRFIRITLTQSLDGLWWSIHELQIQGN